MEKLEKTISSFLKAERFTNIIAEVHRLRADYNVRQSSSSSSSSFTDSLMTSSLEFLDRISFREMDLRGAGRIGSVAAVGENTEGISVCRDGDFFAVNQVSLLDQEIQAQECIQQLEAVINLKGNDGYGSPADIWSLGCTVLEMCTGQIPYSNLQLVQALFRIGRGTLPEVPDTLLPDARDFILKCLKVNPEERPTAAELLNHPFVRRPLPSLGSCGSGSASP